MPLLRTVVVQITVDVEAESEVAAKEKAGTVLEKTNSFIRDISARHSTRTTITVLHRTPEATEEAKPDPKPPTIDHLADKK